MTNGDRVPVAFVVLKREISEEELRTFMKKQLASYKQPVDYYFVDQLPRNASNKLLRRELIQSYKKHLENEF